MSDQPWPRPVADLADLRAHFDGDARYVEAHGDEAALLAYRARLLEGLLDLRPGQRLLEVGCGDGRHLAALAEGSAGLGVDLSPGMIAAAKDRAAATGQTRLAFRVDAAETLATIPSSTIDRVFSVGSLEHMLDQAAAIRSMARVLRPGGRIALLTPNGGSLFNRWLAPALGIETRRLQTDRYPTPRALRRMLAAAGFAAVETGFWTFVQRGDLDARIARALDGSDRIGRRLGIGLLRGGLSAAAVRPR